jgi:tetratricopeptide (TPR) repeat protein
MVCETRRHARLVLALLLLLHLTATIAFGNPQRRSSVTSRGEVQYGKFILPNGESPRGVIGFTLTSHDGDVTEFLFGDVGGRFSLPRLEQGRNYTINVAGQDGIFGTTIFDFDPQFERELRVALRAPAKSSAAPDLTVSAASFYQPNGKAVKLHHQALEYILRNNFSAAETRLREAIIADEKFAPPLNDLAVLYMRRKDYAQAEGLLERVLASDPKHLTALLNVGITRIYLRKYAQAIPALQETLRQDPRILSAHLHLGVALVETDQFNEAERELRMVLESLKEENSLTAIRAKMYLGKLYARTGEFEKSLAYFEEYLRLAPWAENADEVRRVMQTMRAEMAKRN